MIIYSGEKSSDSEKDIETLKVEGDYRLDALARILSSGQLRTSERNRQFLRFVVEETVFGRANRIKAFTVAVDVFGRDANFDASVDPIVRIAAGHLRRALDEYYRGYGRADPVRIIMPLGTYVPEFIRRERFSARLWAGLKKRAIARSGAMQSGSVSISIALVGAGLAMAYLGLVFLGGGANQKPVIVIENTMTSALSQEYTDLFTQTLWTNLGHDKRIRVVTMRADDDFSSVLSRARTDFESSAPLYHLVVSFQREHERVNIFWHLVDGRTSLNQYSSSGTLLVKEEGEPDMRAAASEVAASLQTFLQKAP